VNGTFKYDVINNTRTGEGRVHVRAEDAKELESIKRKIEAKGLVVDVAKSYRPLWKK
jgi:peptidyl-tRNA hydrolase